MRKKQLLLVVMAFMVFLPSFLASATAHVEAAPKEGKLTSKEEVVYATLRATGELDSIYVVNTLNVAEAGEILDYGEYSGVKNLTDLSALDQEGQTVRLNAPEGKFYYQGNMKGDSELPWDISVSYLLDGQEADPSTLAGKTGHVEINIETAANQEVDSVFYENYLLQISMTFPNTYRNIETSGGMIANAGKNKQITFTVMPEKEEKLTVEADVEDFEFQGVEIAAVPSTLPIDTSEMDTMTEDMGELSDAIRKLNNGVADLKKGVVPLNNGAADLRDGSAKFNNGMSKLDGSSPEIVGASRSIQEALVKISKSMSGGSAEMDLSGLQELPGGLTKLADALTQTADGLSELQKNYGPAYGALDGAIGEIPGEPMELTEKEIAALYASGVDPKKVEKLLVTYEAAQKVKGTYAQVKGAFDAVEPALTEVDKAVRRISGELNAIATDLSASLEEMDLSGLNKLQQGLAQLSSDYGQFHAGLVDYTNGVGELSTSYTKLHSGIVDLSGGTNELLKGVGKLHDGTSELYQETKDLPNQMQEEINQMIKEYDKSDFEPVSYVSSKNEKVSSVQFVIKTESIERVEQEEKKEEQEEEKGFWDRLLELF